jgi:hypothetical protein
MEEGGAPRSRTGVPSSPTLSARAARARARMAQSTGPEPVASGVTGLCQFPQIAADPGQSGSAVSLSWPSDTNRGRAFRNVLQDLARAGTQ